MDLVWPYAGAVDDEALVRAYAPDRTRPGVRLNFVTSLDGAVAVAGRSKGLSNAADRTVFHLLRAHADAVMVGAGTLRDEGYGPVKIPHSAWRADLGLAEHPTLVIVSASLDLDPSLPAFVAAPVRPIVLTLSAAPAGRREPLQAVADVVACGDSVVDLAVGVAVLRKRGLEQVLCEGGPRLFGALLAADLVDELCLTISPLLVGPGPRRIVAGDVRPEPLGMRPVHVIVADGALLTRYTRAA